MVVIGSDVFFTYCAYYINRLVIIGVCYAKIRKAGEEIKEWVIEVGKTVKNSLKDFID
ncbi:hypothetical protein GOY07_03920 [Wolbachia endosymbiont of Litomosoides sigmodontis]|uniref:hypothetical protein n=1 Tax=Wolbachia endosymbiont of Litomosoides sigmodontis TaxID=80850 RepID=UPI001588CA9B|nr:hypothetical protein [Wolbachia endosymbiont of Litomosoides sigmodontis]QKX03278.1 hypothetical protein GOY07_03920 [Wolbachia endosymbiont of Litomosoides sigmodontis]